MATRACKCVHRERRESDVVVKDRYEKEVTLGSIVEIMSHPMDRYTGLFYVVAIDVKPGQAPKLLLAQERWGKWDLAVAPSRVSLRCFRPERDKGE